VDRLLTEIRYAVRGLLRAPGFTAAAVLTLALGIGANTAIFSVVDQLLLRPLPYPNGDQLLTIHETFRSATVVWRTGTDTNRNAVSPANWLDWQRESRTLRGVAAWDTTTLTLTEAGEPVRLNVQVVSSEFFPLLGVQPLLGRTLSEEDDRPKAPRVVVLSHHLWQQRFSGDPDIIGRSIRLNDTPVEVIGVMPSGFRFIYHDNDLWGASQLDRSFPWRERSGRFMNVVARLQPGATIESARAELEALAARLEQQYEFNRNTGVTLVPLREDLTGQVRTSLLVLYAAVGVLLAIACFNIANLLLARAVSRRREVAIRTSLGVPRSAILRQFVIESLLLALVGGGLGIVLARWSLDALMAFAPPELLRVPELFVDRPVLLYALGLSVLTGLVCGLAPAALAARRSIVESMRMTGSTLTHAPRARQALVVCQVAMTVVLLCGAGVLARTVIALNTADNGVDRGNLLTMEVAVPGARYAPERRTAFFADVIAALRALPGVQSAAAGNSLPVIGTLRGGSWFHRLGTPEVPAPERSAAAVRVVTPGYFRTLGIPVLRGREFTQADEANPIQGFVVNKAFADAFLADVDPLLVSLTVWMQEKNPYLPVIGVVGNVSEGSVRDNPQPTVFYSHKQMPETTMTLFVRTAQPTALAGAAVDVVRRVDSTVPVIRLRTFEEALAESIARERLSALVFLGLAATGLLLASLGLYALLAFLVAERTKEIGIRIALGAHLGRLTRSVVGGGLRLAGIGAAVGLAASFMVLQPLGTLLFGVTPYDLSTYAVVLALLCTVAAVASYLPAHRAASIDPLVALREE
jgi:putative ABC transport system permease protein